MKKALIFLSLILFAQNTLAQIQADGKAGLVITPTRVEIDNKQRSASVTLANNGYARGVYKIMLVNKTMTESGEIVEAKAGDKGDFADKFLRISPRRVVIEPGQSQSIRILARLPKDLASGEYRSHLSVMIIPDEDDKAPADLANDQLIIAVKANYGVSIPVIVRHGKVSAYAQMGKVSYRPANKEKKDDAHVIFNITRSGNESLYGDIKIIHVSNKGEQVVKTMGGIAVYTPNTLRKFDITLDSTESAKIAGGTIKVLYQEKEKDGGKVLAQGDLKL
jgi:P pilus assembly chaperone PapD